MYAINKVVSIKESPFKQSIDLQLIKLCETVTPFYPIAYLDYTRLKTQAGRLRFLVKAAYGNRDK